MKKIINTCPKIKPENSSKQLPILKITTITKNINNSNGNLITRIGHYGNHDSMGPKSLKPVGGDEVAMIHGAYLAIQSDKYLYIADIGNDRIISVKLNYATNEIMAFPEI